MKLAKVGDKFGVHEERRTRNKLSELQNAGEMARAVLRTDVNQSDESTTLPTGYGGHRGTQAKLEFKPRGS